MSHAPHGTVIARRQDRPGWRECGRRFVGIGVVLAICAAWSAGTAAGTATGAEAEAGAGSGAKTAPGAAVPGEILVRFQGAAPAIDFGRVRSEDRPGRTRVLYGYVAGKAGGEVDGVDGIDRIDRIDGVDAAGAGKAEAAEDWAEWVDGVGLIGVEPLVPATTAADRRRTPAAAARFSPLHRLVFSPDIDMEATLTALRRMPGVAYAEPNGLGTLAYTPSDPLWPSQSNSLSAIGLEAAWQAQLDATGTVGGDPGVRVAVIDSGIEATHPDLSGAVDLATSYNFVEANTSIRDDIGHGTRVGGIIGATGGNGEGIAGVAFGCSLMSLDVANAQGQVTVADVVSAINWAVANDADVINLSLRFVGESRSLEEACAAAAASGAVVVAAAGNENQGDFPVYPASYSTAIGVGSVLADGLNRAPFSNYNGAESTLVDLVAPGVEIFSTIPGDQYNGTFGSGTSFSAPVAAGVAALLKSMYPDQSGPALRHRLETSATPLAVAGSPSGWDGFGLIDAATALSAPFTPRFRVASVAVDDALWRSIVNNEDGSPDQGETVALVVTLVNDGADAVGVSATLATANPWVTLPAQSASWGDVAHGVGVSGIDPFTTVSLAAGAPAQPMDFSLTVDWTGAAGPEILTFSLRSEDKRVVAHGTNYFTPTTWTADKTWVVEGQVNVFADLTVEPGTTVRCGKYGRIEVLGGKLSAAGTSENPIRFLSIEDLGNRDSQKEGELTWARGIRTDYSAYTLYHVNGFDVAALPDGGLYAVGSFNGYAVFGEGEPNQTRLSSPGNTDIFLARYAADGTLLWVRRAGGSTFDDTAKGVALMPDGGAVVVGSFTAQATFGAGTPAAVTLTATGGMDVFVARYDPDGNLLWVEGAGSSQNDEAVAVATLPDGRIWVTGSYIGTGTFGKGEAGETMLQGFGGLDVFLAQYAPTGSLVWARRAGGVSADESHGLAVDSSGFAVIAGEFRGQAVFGKGEAGETTLSAQHSSALNCFVARYTPTGALAWAKRAGSIESSDWSVAIGRGVTLHPDGQIFVAGSFSGSSTFGPGELGAQTLTSAGQGDVFVAGFEPNGTLSWARSAGSERIERPEAIVLGEDDCLYVTGLLTGVCTFGKNEEFETSVGTSSIAAAFLARYELDGQFRLVRVIDGTQGADLVGRALDVFPGGDVVVGGDYFESVVLGAGEPNETTLTSFQDGVFLARVRSLPHWDGLIVRGTSQGAELAHCVFDGGRVVNESAETTVGDCRFRQALGGGFSSAAGTSAIADCDAELNLLDGMRLGNRAGSACVARRNGRDGILALGEVSDCAAEANGRDGLIASAIRRCESIENGEVGLVSAGGIAESRAVENGGAGAVSSDTSASTRMLLRKNGAVSEIGVGGVGFNGGDDVTSLTSERNGGFGLDALGEGLVSGCRVVQNGGGGIRTNGTFVRDSAIVGNDGAGVTGTGLSALERCRVTDNVGAAMAGVESVRDCVVDGNGSGIVGASTVETSLISGSVAAGVTGGAIASCSVVNNAGHGVASATSIGNSWIVGNAGVGVFGNYAGFVSSSTIRMNAAGGVADLGPEGLQGSNIEGNGVFEAKDTQPRSGFQITSFQANDWIKNFESNYWGAVVTPWMESNPFLNDRDPEIVDGFDGSNGWFLDYSPAASGPVVDAPNTAPPSFLLSVTPNLEESTNIGPAVFTLTFSGPMNTAVNPSVTFHTQSPYTQYVVEPSPGWTSDRAWRGVYAVGTTTGNGTHTLRVSGAMDAHGFLLPDDTAHRFAIEVSGDLPAHNGLALALGDGGVVLSWTENEKPPDALGYNVRRAPVGPLSQMEELIFEKINDALVTPASYDDRTALSDYVYFYIIDLVDVNGNSIEWVGPTAFATTGLITETPTFTPTPSATVETPTPSFPPTETPTFTPDTPTDTPTRTSTETPTHTPYPSMTVTRTETPTKTPSPTPTDIPTPSPSPLPLPRIWIVY